MQVERIFYHCVKTDLNEKVLPKLFCKQPGAKKWTETLN